MASKKQTPLQKERKRLRQAAVRDVDALAALLPQLRKVLSDSDTSEGQFPIWTTDCRDLMISILYLMAGHGALQRHESEQRLEKKYRASEKKAALEATGEPPGSWG